MDDEAVYICEAQNYFGRIQTGATITVTGLGTSNNWLQKALYIALLGLKAACQDVIM